jgi:putative MATE family efflux protein
MNNGLTTAPISTLIRQLAVPASIGFFFNTMYNVVDTYFAGLISTQALAALSLSFPVFFIIIAMGSGIATGATALIGTAMGAADRDRARLFAAQSLTFGVCITVGLTAAGPLAAPFLFRLLGASDAYLHDCLRYMDTIFAGTLFFMLVFMLNAMLNAQGDTRSYRNFLLAAFGLNVLLDPWFIYGGFGLPAMGIRGIALATVLVHLIGCVYLGYKVYRTRILAGCPRQCLWPRSEPFREIAHQGFPASLNFMTIALGTFVITFFVSKFGQEAVAAYGIGLRVEQIVLLPTIGLNVATLTLVAQNHGAGLAGRVRESLHTALLYGGGISAVGTVLVLVFSRLCMAVFTDDPTVIRIGVSYLHVDALVLYAYVLIFVNIAALQGLKQPVFAMLLGLYRQIAAPLIVFYAFTDVFHFGVKGIWGGIFLITWSAAAIAVVYTRRRLTRILGTSA